MVGIINCMNYLSLMALVHLFKDGPQVPGEWIETTLCEHLGGYYAASDPTPRTRAWAVGGVLGRESLVQMRPVVRGESASFTDDFLRAPCQCTIAGFVAAGGASQPPRFGISRFQRWIALTGNQAILPDPEANASLHRRLREDLPPFIRRTLRDRSDRELLGMSVIASLHAATASSKTYAEPHDFREALRQLDAAIGRPETVDVMVSDGRTVGILHRGGEAYVIEPPAPDRRRLMTSKRPGEDAGEEAPDAAFVLLSPPGSPPPSAAGGLTAIRDEVFTLRARHPVRIGRD